MLCACVPNRIALAATVVVTAPVPGGGGGGGGQGGGGDIVPGEAIVELVRGASIETFNAAYGTATIAQIPQLNLYLVSLPDDMTMEDLEWIEERDPDVEEVEAEYEAEASPEPATQSFFVAVMQGEYLQQWAIDLTGVDTAHEISKGAGVLVAVVDGGVDTDHPHLASRLSLPGLNLATDTADIEDIGDGVDNDGDGHVDEMVGHGTLVAGIIARVAPDAEILPLRVLDDEGRTTTFQIAAAIYEAVDRGADIINVSMGAPEDPDILRDAVLYAQAHDVVVVACAGNSDSDDDAWSPAMLRDLGAIGVAATDADDLKAPFSDFGEYIAISAPGVDIVGTLPGGRYGKASGTSFAAPIVSGAVALLRGFCPDIAAADLEQILFTSARNIDVGNPEFAGLLGAGRIDLSAALESAGPPLCRHLIGDLDDDHAVDLTDLVILLDSWNDGECLMMRHCRADLDGNGEVGLLDLQLLLSNFGSRM